METRDQTEAMSCPDIPLLSPADIGEFQELLRAETGKKVGYHEAWDRATELIALGRMLVRPDPEDVPET
jgi:hypothetical protein